MKFLRIAKDGGPESTVTGLFLIEIKGLFSVVLLRFANGSRDAYHSHAFNALSWVLRGRLVEYILPRVAGTEAYFPSFKPVYTPRERFHRVVSVGTTWVLSFRGPWADKWEEYIPAKMKFITLTDGRKVA